MKNIALETPNRIMSPEQLLERPAGAVERLARCDEGGSRMLILPVQLQKLIVHMHDLPTDAEAAIINRIKYLIKIGFPRKFETVKGGRSYLGIDDILVMSIAFELFAFGASNAFVIGAVNSGRKAILKALCSAWPAALMTDTASEPLLVIRGGGLLNEGTVGESGADGPALDISTTTTSDLLFALASELGRGPIMLLNLALLLRRLSVGITEGLMATAKQLDAEMAILSEETFGSTDAKRAKSPREAARA